uniref:RING-type domain-containing protein n=1 Tax=Timema poppense TaxID=170557 RepID=A0A7R9H5L9_TIMPO|nr:unnamed protein product [Timema poppensis]
MLAFHDPLKPKSGFTNAVCIRPMTSLVLTDSSQLTADGFEKLPDKIMYPYAEPYDLQIHVKQMVRMMPCGHQFHDRCLCQWLLQTSGTCPIDGSVVKPTLLHKTLRRECRPPPARCRGQRKSLPEVRGKAGVVAPSISVQRVVLVERRYPSQSPSLESRKEWITPLR